MKFAFMNLGCPNWSLEQTAEMASLYGYDGVELRSAPDNQILFPDAPLTHRLRVKETFEKRGLKICAVAAYSRFSFSDESGFDENRKILTNDIILARDLGAPVVRSFLGENKELTHSQIIKQAAPYINYCCDFAADLGITVAFETHDMWCRSEPIREAFDAITSAGASVLWDAGNNFLAGEPFEKFFAAAGSRCSHVHIKDMILLPDGGHKYTLPGEGSVPFGECFDLLRKNGYAGYVTFEWEKRWHPELEEPEAAFPAFIQYVKGL